MNLELSQALDQLLNECNKDDVKLWEATRNKREFANKLPTK